MVASGKQYIDYVYYQLFKSMGRNFYIKVQIVHTFNVSRQEDLCPHYTIMPWEEATVAILRWLYTTGARLLVVTFAKHF